MISDCHWIQYTANMKFVDYFDYVGTKKGINGEKGIGLENDIYQLVLFENKIVWNLLSDRNVKNEEKGKWNNKDDLSGLISIPDTGSACLAEACQNGATCRDVDSTYECLCPQGKNYFIQINLNGGIFKQSI